MIEKYDATLYKSENFDILKYCYENYAHNVYVKEFIKKMTIASKENNDMHESIVIMIPMIWLKYPLMNMLLAILVAMMSIFMKMSLL